jgi:hypothetical protein
LWPEVTRPAVIYRSLPSLAAIGLGSYAAFALLVAAAVVWIDLWRVRTRLKSLVSPSRQEWDAGFSGTSLTRFGLRLVQFASDGSGNGDDEVLVRSRLSASASRREIRAVYWDWLVRIQCLTAIAVLAVMVGFCVAQSYTSAMPSPDAAGLSQLLVWELLGIAFLGFLTLAAISLAAESLLDTIAAVPFHYVDTALLHSLGSGAAGVPTPVTNLLATLLERDQKTLGEAISRIAETGELLSAIAQSGPAADITMEPSRLEKFSVAVDRLAAAIERTAHLPYPAASRPEPVSNRMEPAPEQHEQPSHGGDLSRDLRALLKEFD